MLQMVTKVQSQDNGIKIMQTEESEDQKKKLQMENLTENFQNHGTSVITNGLQTKMMNSTKMNSGNTTENDDLELQKEFENWERIGWIDFLEWEKSLENYSRSFKTQWFAGSVDSQERKELLHRMLDEALMTISGLQQPVMATEVLQENEQELRNQDEKNLVEIVKDIYCALTGEELKI